MSSRTVYIRAIFTPIARGTFVFFLELGKRLRCKYSWANEYECNYVVHQVCVELLDILNKNVLPGWLLVSSIAIAQSQHLILNPESSPELNPT